MPQEIMENLRQLTDKLHQIAVAIYRNPKTGNLYGKIEDWRIAVNNESIHCVYLSNLLYKEKADNSYRICDKDELRKALIEEIPYALENEKYIEREKEGEKKCL